MTTKILAFLWLLLTVLLPTGFSDAQQPAKVPRVVWLTTGPISIIAARLEAFRQGMRELGYVEGKIF